MLCSMGVLRRGHLVEADRASLVAGYSGQTAIKTMACVESALGGVLFVDEAYALVRDERDSFGREALDTLLKLMEDSRDDIVVILAGYVDEIDQLLTVNPGLRSRFPTSIDFPDYSAGELRRIADGILDGEQLKIDDDGAIALDAVCADLARGEGGNRVNGNGRAVRNLIEQAKRRQALRLATLDTSKSDMDDPQWLMLLTGDDIRG
jgi:stage V sporulation protein K